MDGDFSEVPVLDYSLALSIATKPQFLSELRNALVKVGFFYLSNHSIPEKVQQDAIEQSTAFFNLPLKKKLEIETVHSKHFLGYNRMDAEKTVAVTGHNESVFFGPDFPAPGAEEPVYLNMHGPSQWPDEVAVPGFRHAIEKYRSAIQDVATSFTHLIPEALGIEESLITRLFDNAPFSRLNFRRYPPPPPKTNSDNPCHGIAPHKDSSFMTYLLQDGDHSCLEVQNKSGDWISVPPIPGTLVVNIGRLLEILTRGVCTATTHRVILGEKGFLDQEGNNLGPRLSIPFFQNVSLNLLPDDLSLDVPPHIAHLAKSGVVSDSGSFFSGLFNHCVGDTVFVSMLTSFVGVAARWYPELLPLALKRQADTKLMDQQRGVKVATQ